MSVHKQIEVHILLVQIQYNTHGVTKTSSKPHVYRHLAFDKGLVHKSKPGKSDLGIVSPVLSEVTQAFAPIIGTMNSCYSEPKSISSRSPSGWVSTSFSLNLEIIIID